jgi:hypothetical protein
MIIWYPAPPLQLAECEKDATPCRENFILARVDRVLKVSLDDTAWLELRQLYATLDLNV